MDVVQQLQEDLPLLDLEQLEGFAQLFTLVAEDLER